MTAAVLPGLAMDVDAEIAWLIDQLHATDERLEELLDGEVDSVADKNGRVMLLRRAQGHVRQSNQDRQAAIVDALPAHIALLDRSGTIISVNEAWRVFGNANGMTDANHAVGRNYVEQCCPEGTDALEACQAAEGIRGVLKGTLKFFSMEYPCHGVGEQRWFLLTVTPLPSSPPNGAVVMHLNVTDRKLAAQQAEALSLRTARREQMLTTMLSSISDLVYTFDREGRVLFANQPLLDVWGLTLEAAIGKNHLELGYPDEVSVSLHRYISQVFETRKGLAFEDSHIGRGLHDDFHEHVYSPAFLPDGSVDFVVGTSRNITERRRSADALHGLNAELETRVTLRTQALARQEALFHALADQAPAIIWTLDAAAQNITYMNRAGVDLLGGSPDDWTGKGMLLRIHPDDLEASAREQQRGVQSSSHFMMIRRLRAQDGSFRIMSCRASPILDESGKVDFWVGLEVDITEVKEVESTLRASIRELEAFAYSIAHDLRSPLTLIDGFGRLLEKELGPLVSARAIHYFSRMRAGIKQMDEVSAGLLSLAGVSRSVLKLEMIDLSQVAREVSELLAERHPDRKIDFVIQPEMLALCDRGMLRSLLWNLIGNAIKFSAKVERAEISLTSLPPEIGQVPLYQVQDNGVGFDMTYVDKLFAPFQRLHTDAEFEGTGIGLATVRRIVERHGGWIEAAGVVGQGACMSFTLSACDGPEGASHESPAFRYGVIERQALSQALGIAAGPALPG